MLLLPIAYGLALTASLTAVASGAPPIQTNDNRVPAGRFAGGVQTIQLRAAPGVWRPEGDAGRALTVEAFAEGAAAPSIPAPLIRVTEGTVIHATVRNDLPHALQVHGLCDRSARACQPIEIPAGETRTTQFASGPAGTYYYWATTSGMPQRFRAADDAQLSGAFIVDPADGALLDRVFLITEWTGLSRSQLHEIAARDDPGAAFLALKPDLFFSINGRIWPHTERLRYAMSTPVRWRVINLSTQVHPMHLHGFYFEVDSLGNGLIDEPSDTERRPRVVTQMLPPGGTMAMTWRPERAGNWLFHCHVMTHVSPTLHVDGSPKPVVQAHADHLPGAGMTGMVLGVTVDGPESAPEWPEPVLEKRTLTLEMRSDPRRFGEAPAFGFMLAGVEGAAPEGVPTVPGPVLVLTRGQRVEITLVNRLPEGTAIHWHGMELDSYYDGVHGWSGTATRVTPMIDPGETFVVRFTPPRTGTFMYHTHLHDRRQLTSGLYGAMLVVEPGEAFDARTDHVVVLGRGGPDLRSPVIINERSDPVFVWKAGARHRVRLINITPDDIVAISLQSSTGPLVWRPLTKDGAPLPAETGPRDARQVIGVGETYDFEVEAPTGRQNLWLEIRSPGGKWLAQAQVIVR
jgi:FtsP/CotA-like multicopper oxidase with cupredoxin domain